MISILDPGFRYVPSGSTDIRKTFARVRRDLQKSEPLAAVPGSARQCMNAVSAAPRFLLLKAGTKSSR